MKFSSPYRCSVSQQLETSSSPSLQSRNLGSCWFRVSGLGFRAQVTIKNVNFCSTRALERGIGSRDICPMLPLAVPGRRPCAAVCSGLIYPAKVIQGLANFADVIALRKLVKQWVGLMLDALFVVARHQEMQTVILVAEQSSRVPCGPIRADQHVAWGVLLIAYLVSVGMSQLWLPLSSIHGYK